MDVQISVEAPRYKEYTTTLPLLQGEITLNVTLEPEEPEGPEENEGAEEAEEIGEGDTNTPNDNSEPEDTNAHSNEDSGAESEETLP